MPPSPIFTVELVTSARRARYFFIRAAYATVLLCVLGVVYGTTWMWQTDVTDIHYIAALSAAFFNAFSWMQMLAVVLLGPAMVAGTIATERERRTIEYLFASRLSNAEIVLGKLAARLVHVVCLILAGVPVLALAMLLGGVAPEALLALLILTLCTTLTVCSLSIAVSVWSARAREAVTRAYLVLFVLLFIPLILLSFTGQRFFDQYLAPVNQQFVSANPFFGLTTVIMEASGTNRAGAMDLLLAFARNHLIASFALATMAVLGVRRAHLTQQVKTTKRRRWRVMQFLRPSVGDRPMLWKEIFAEPAASRLGAVGRIALTLLVLAVLVPTVYVFYMDLISSPSASIHHGGSASEYFWYVLWMGTLLSCVGLLIVASRAAGSIASERERDCWTSLISTPLKPSEIVWAKIAGSVWSIRGLVLLLLLLWGLGVVLEPQFLITVPFLLGTFLVLALYAAALGVNFSLRCRSSLRAMGATLAIGLFLGGGYWFCCMPLTAVGTLAFSSANRVFMEAFFSFLLAPCVPYLLTAPGVFYVSGEHPSNSSAGGMMLFAYILGVIGYGVASLVLIGRSISAFRRPIRSDPSQAG